MFKLTGRYYRTIPITDPGYAYEDLELDPVRTTLIAMHCWNIGCEDGPEIDKDYWVGMGFQVTYRETERIMREHIRPAMDAARKVGVMVSHVESGTVRANREKPTGQKGIFGPPREPEGWRERITWRSHGVEYPTRSPLTRMDRAKIVEPLPGEPLVWTTEELHKTLQERRIENLIYSGFATDMCILNAPGGIEHMAPLNYRIFLMRDATIGVECPDTFEERIATRWAIRFFETHYGDTITSDDFIKACREIGSG